MATRQEAEQTILDLIAEVAKVQSPTATPNDEAVIRTQKGTVILQLSEAYAWLVSPAQPHGGPHGK